MSLTSGVLAPALAVGLLSSPANLDGGGGETSLLRPELNLTEKISLSQPLIRTAAGYWRWNGIEIHASDFKVAYERGADSPLIWFSGKIPNVTELSQRIAAEFDAHTLHPVQARGLFAEHLRRGSWAFSIPRPVIHLGERPEAWWTVTLPESGRVFWLRESDGLWGEEPPIEMFANAIALIHRENPVASAASGLEEITLPDLLDVSYLRNRIFRVLNCLDKAPSFKTCGNYARSLSGRYTYPLESNEHSEMVGYYAINRAMEWHRGIQSEEQKKAFFDFGLAGPIDVFVRAVKEGAPLYTPRASTLDSSNPAIYVPFSESNLGLTNLSIDSDVFLHEFAHHVLYRAVAPVRRDDGTPTQAFAVQEGLADYFTYAVTGNNKLAESVDARGVLREGNKTENLTVDVMDFSLGLGQVYVAGELLSSVFWKLRQQLGEWKNGYFKIDKVVWDAIDLLPKEATFYQLACAVVKQSEIFEKSENLPANSLKSPVVQELAVRQFFENTTVNPTTGCPAVSAVLKTVDEREAKVSELPPPTTRPDVTFTGAGRSALPPFGGSLYQPLQPRRVGCGDLSNTKRGGGSSAPVVVLLLLPFVFGVLRSRKYFF